MVLVPQEGFLFDDTLAANVRYGRLDATEDDILASADELGLGDWLAGLPRGLDTRVGQRGESLSAGERQLVALLRAHLADPDLLVLDEATSAVDPALEMRIGRALERLMSGRTSVTIAHRLSTAENADEVVVVDRGRIVQRGPHAELVAPGGRLRRPARLLGGPAGADRRPGILERCDRPSTPPSPPGSSATADGLVPAVVQQHDTGEVLMLGWMDDEALARTLDDRPGDVLEPVAPGVLGQGRDLRPPRSGSRRSASTATATPCWSRSTRRAPPATPATAPASTPTSCIARRLTDA